MTKAEAVQALLERILEDDPPQVSPVIQPMREGLLQLRAIIDKMLGLLGVEASPSDEKEEPVEPVKPEPPITVPPPPSLDQPEPKKSKWAKFGGVLKKVWPVASVGLLAVPGGAAIAAGVNAAIGAGTADPSTAAVTGLIVPAAVAVVKGMQKD